MHLDEEKVMIVFVLLSRQFCRKMEGLRTPRDERRRAQHNEGVCGVCMDLLFFKSADIIGY